MAPVDTTSERVSWYLVQIKPNSYRIAERALQRQGYSVFCPLLEISQVRAGRSSLVKKPLFPGYLFVAFDPLDAPWRAINNTHGVSRLVTFGENYPPAVPNALVVSLMSRCDEEGKLLQLSLSNQETWFRSIAVHSRNSSRESSASGPISASTCYWIFSAARRGSDYELRPSTSWTEVSVTLKPLGLCYD